MAQPPPLRRRDRNPRLEDDYYASDAGPYDPRSRYRSPDPPRRHKSEHRRRSSPAYDMPPPRSRRDAPPREGRPLGERRYARSPPPPYTSEPRRGLSNREPPRSSHREPELGGADPYDRRRRPMEHGAGGSPPKSHRSDHGRDRDSASARFNPDDRHAAEPRHRGRHSPPPAAYDMRNGGDPRARHSRHSPPGSGPGPRSHGRDDPYGAGYGGFGGDDRHGGGGRRPRSHDRGLPRDRMAPSPTRGRPPPSTTGRGGGAPTRRNSMPASTKDKKAAWWQNPLVQAGVTTALSAGARAAMNNRKEQGPWMGPKGAKVATAALGAALMDGFMGNKEGKDKQGSKSRDREGGSKSRGGGGNTKEALLREGVNFVAKQAAQRQRH